METAYTNATQSLATRPGVDRRTRAAKRWAVLHQQFTAALPNGVDSGATEALLQSLTGISLEIEQSNRRARKGEAIDGDVLLRLTATQSRLMRQLKLAEPLEQRHPQRRLSMTARQLESELERRSDEGGSFGPLGEYIEAQGEKLAALAKKYSFDPIIADDSRGGRLRVADLVAANASGDVERCRELVRRAKREFAEAQELLRRDEREEARAKRKIKRVRP